MAQNTMPQINVIYREKAKEAIKRSMKGTAALIVRDAIADEGAKTYALRSAAQIPAELGEENQKAIRNVFTGYDGQPPTRVLVYVLAAVGTVTTGCDCLKWLATQQWDYLAGHAELSTEEAQVIKAWVIQQRTDYHALYKAVLPNTAADNEALINFAASGIKTADGTYTTAAYCGRIAGLIAGCPMNQSVTNAVLPEVKDIDRKTGPEEDTAVGNGQLILTYDEEKVKLGLGVNSLTTVTAPKQENWKKIKVMETHDMISRDIRSTIKEHYIGKVSNTYDNKMLLVTAIREYLDMLSRGESAIIDEGFTADIDVPAQEAYLQSKGISTLDMSEDEIKRANTDTHVFLVISYIPLDVMENVQVVIAL